MKRQVFSQLLYAKRQQTILQHEAIEPAPSAQHKQDFLDSSAAFLIGCHSLSKPICQSKATLTHAHTQKQASREFTAGWWRVGGAGGLDYLQANCKTFLLSELLFSRETTRQRSPDPTSLSRCASTVSWLRGERLVRRRTA